MRKIVVICGNIGAGKSTILAEAEKNGHDVYPEPVNEWGPLLAQVYRSPRNSQLLMRLQSLIYSHYCRLSEHLSASGKEHDEFSDSVGREHDEVSEARYDSRGGDDSVAFVERCPAEALHVFLPANRESFDPDDYAALVRMHERLVELPVWKNATYVMLSAPVEVCRDRIKKRSRDGEECVSQSYLSQMELLQTRAFIPRMPRDPIVVESLAGKSPRDIYKEIVSRVRSS